MSEAEVYRADPSLKGKLRRRLVRLYRRRPATLAPQRPMVSFTFDDVPRSAAMHGAHILEGKGARGTFLACASLAGTDFNTGRLASLDELAALASRGHEIGCHSYDHIDCGQADEATISTSLRRNADAMARFGLPAPRSFAYPYGDVSAAAKRAVDQSFAISRGLHPGLVRKGTDLNQAPAIGLEGEASAAVARRFMDEAAATNGWLIFFTHGVSDTPGEFDMSVDTFAALVDHADGLGLAFVTLSEGARAMTGA